MKDRHGKPVSIGARVFVLPTPETGRDGGQGWVRDIKPKEGWEWRGGSRVHARVDNGPKAQRGQDDWTWSAWCDTSELEVLEVSP